MERRFEAAVAAIDAGDCAELKRLLEANPGLVRQRCEDEGVPYDGYFRRPTLLHFCAGNPLRGAAPPANIVDVARTLLDAGAEVDAATEFRDDWNWTTLGLAASSGPAAVSGFAEPLIDLLLERGADIDWGGGINLYGAFYHAVECANQRDVAAFLRRRGAAVDLGYAAAVGDLDALDTFFDARGVPTQDAYTRYRPLANRLTNPTPQQLLDEALVFAATNARTEAVERLLQRGARLDGAAAVGHERPTPLHAAVWGGSLDLTRRLVELGADATRRDGVHRSSALGWAAFLGRAEILAFLTEDDARIDLRDAIELGRFENVEARLEGIDVNSAVGDGDPGILLRGAAYHGNLELVRELLRRGADPRLGNADGQTALDYAADNGHDAVASALREALEAG